MRNSIVLLLWLTAWSSIGQNKILFDASKAQAAGNADWVIDADLHNIFFSSGPAIPNTGGTESNAQRFPTPAQNTVTASTPEDYWQGGISYWALDCVKKGYTVESLPYNGQITYGNAANAQDLSNYKAFIVDEPNILFTAAQKTAILNYVANGGGLFMIADHDISDRNNDTYDSPHIWNDLMTTNTVQANPFGITFDYVDFTQTSTNVLNSATDPILHGTAGNVTRVYWSGGTSMTLNTSQNPAVKGVVFKTGSSTSGTTNVLCAYTTYGQGKVAAIGDSSIADDGTGDTIDTLFDGYIADANGNHQRLLMNITNWLMAPNMSTDPFEAQNAFSLLPNPTTDLLTVYTDQTTISVNELLVFDLSGRLVGESKTNTMQVTNLAKGTYLLQIIDQEGKIYPKKFLKN
jgi:hypothetical protein